MGNIRPPQYGVKKDELTLTTQDPNAVMYGVTSDNKFIPIKITNTGELLLGGTITLEPGDLQIGAVEIKNHNTDDRVFVSTGLAMRVDSQLQGFDSTTPGWEDITSTNVLGKQGVDVNVIGGGSLGISEAEDDDIADSKPNVPLFINLGYAHDPNNGRWERLTQKNKRLIIDGSEVTQPISATALPLPAGASTEVTLQSLLTAFNAEDFASETTLSAINTKVATEVTLSSILSKLDVSLSTRASELTLSSINGKVIKADTDNVTVISSVLPTGAATELTLGTIDTKLNSLGQKLMATSMPVVIASDQSSLPINGIVSVSNFPAVQAIAIDQTGTNNNVDANITNTSLNVNLRDGGGNSIGSVAGALKIDGSGVTQPISAISLPLPTGASTEATLVSIDTTLSSQLDVLLSTRASEATLSALNVKVIKADTDNVTVVSIVNPPINGAHETLVRIPFGSVPAAYGVGAQLTTTADRNHFQVRNDADKNIIVSIDGTNDHYFLKKKEIGTWDGVTIPSGSTIRVRYDGAALTKDEVIITAWSDR